MPNFDVFIKDEGYQDVRFVSKKAKQWAHKNKIPMIGREFLKIVLMQKLRKWDCMHGLLDFPIKGFMNLSPLWRMTD
jgi:hypothetical protein